MAGHAMLSAADARCARSTKNTGRRVELVILGCGSRGIWFLDSIIFGPRRSVLSMSTHVVRCAVRFGYAEQMSQCPLLA